MAEHTSNSHNGLLGDDTPDERLVELSKNGSMDAFEELVNRHRDKIYARAFSMMRSEDGAVEMSQLAWIRAWQKLSQFKGDSSFTTWLTRITINICLDEIRKRKRYASDSIDEMDDTGGVERKLPVTEFNPTSGMEREEIRRRVAEAMEELSESHRTVIILHEFEGMEYKEVAEAMGCSIGTVMSRLFYARRRLASLLAGVKNEII